MIRLPPVCAGFILGAFGILSVADIAIAAQTQSTEREAPPVSATTDPSTEPDYLLPDLSQQFFEHETENFWFRPIVAIVADYTFFDQDDPSLAQVGEQEDTRDLRAGRIGLITRSKSEFPWELYFAADYQESRTREDATFRLYDLRFRLPFEHVAIDIGKQKQPFVFEVVGLSILNPQQERILSPFFVTRSIGIRASGQLAGDRMTWAAGWFNDWLETDATFGDNANDYVGRVTGLVSASPDDRDYLHLGLGLRRVGSDDNRVRLSGQPESNVADKYVDTGEFLASHIDQLALELVWDRGPFMLLAEHVKARSKAPASGNPRFSGSYLALSWTLTGESRPYIRQAGVAGPIAPTSRRGAIELVARYSRLDLTDGSIDGGELGKWHFGANWWTSRQWKAGVSYGDADLDRGATIGNTRMWLFRLQWYN